MHNFTIKLGSITNSKNSFSFEVKDQFFETFTFSDIEHAVVIGENNTLTAYIVNENKETGLLDSVSKQKYIDKLAQKLPAFMIPTFFLIPLIQFSF